MKLEEYEQLHPHVQTDGLIFLTPNTHCGWRVDTLLTKEPDTIAWINQMEKDSVLFDVGANMGQYSMLAAQRGINVHAFEPDAQNFALMCRNFALNSKLKGKMMPWPIAFSDATGLDTFFVTNVMAGGSCNSFGEKVDYHLQPKKFKFEQGCFGTTIDEFCAQFGRPDHIKIDVDGLEHKVIAGADHVLLNVKSVLVELNTALTEHQFIIERMAEMGLHPDMVTADKARRTDGAFKGVGNVIFFKNEADFLDVPVEKWKKL